MWLSLPGVSCSNSNERSSAPVLTSQNGCNFEQVRLTPHVAAFTPVATASAQIVENYCALQAREPVLEERVVSRDRGY